MALPALALRAGTAIASLDPATQTKILDKIKSVTGVGTTSQDAGTSLASYVGKSPERAQVLTETLVRQGINLSDIVSSDIAGQNQVLAKVRAGGLKVIETLRNQNSAHADRSISQDIALITPSLLVSIKRVRLALQMYGTPERYFLMNPNGPFSVEEMTCVQLIGKAFSQPI